MNKYYVGQLSRAVTHFNHTDKPADVGLSFKNGSFSEKMPFTLYHEYYVVEKAELDEYMARKEQLEQMNCTPVWDAYNRLKAKVAALEAENGNLRDINKALGEENSKLTEKNEALKDKIERFYGMTSAEEELRAANEKLKKENGELKESVEQLNIIRKYLELINSNLEADNLKRNIELAKYRGVQEVIDIHATCDNYDSYVIMWTDREGQERKIELKLVQNPMDETTGREMDIYDRTRS